MEQIYQFLKRFERLSKNTDLMMAGGLIAIMAVMLVPLPAFMIDISLTLSIAISLLILLVALYTTKPLDFSIFPSLLLITTLFRLALNVATTRIILTEGHNGHQAAGQVVSAFGSYVVGNNYVIGFIVFVILVVINFIVVTKGAGRVAEVAARFTLDAMPGKQMSIDADLNAGLINEKEARRRRKEIEREADFYGAMDGSSKFVRGDAIAGIIITLVNVVGGLLIGVIQRGLDLSTAAQYYTMLTIGDGLVTQIPALIISVAAGMVVTRAGSENDIGQDVSDQLFLKPRAVIITGVIIGLLGMIPNLPGLPFFIMSAVMISIGWVISKNDDEKKSIEAKSQQDEATKPKKEVIENLLPL
ncbi:MAG: FHIPEP family type III secretion protein, partial [Bdellovibrionota bacterium]